MKALKENIRASFYFLLNKFIGFANKLFNNNAWLFIGQPMIEGSPDNFAYGDLSTRHKILYASFNLLNEYVENELSNAMPSFKYIIKNYNISKYHAYNIDFELFAEVKALHNYWNFERKEEYKKIKEIEVIKNKSENQYIQLEYLDNEFYLKEEAMLERLFKIRKLL